MDFSKYEFTQNDLENAQNSLKITNFEDGEIFYNDSCSGFVCVLSGKIRAFTSAPNGRQIILFELKKGDECLICADCLANLGLQITLQSIGKSSFEVLEAAHFRRLKEKYPLFANHILTLLSTRFSSSIEIMSSALFIPLKDRILGFLAQCEGGVCEQTHEQIASFLGSSREAVSRILKELQNSGQIALSRGKIKLLN